MVLYDSHTYDSQELRENPTHHVVEDEDLTATTNCEPRTKRTWLGVCPGTGLIRKSYTPRANLFPIMGGLLKGSALNDQGTPMSETLEVT